MKVEIVCQFGNTTHVTPRFTEASGSKSSVALLHGYYITRVYDACLRPAPAQFLKSVLHPKPKLIKP